MIIPKIQCGFVDCVFLEEGFCGAEIVEIDPDESCITYTSIDDIAMVDDEDWEEEELEEMGEEEDGDF